MVKEISEIVQFVSVNLCCQKKKSASRVYMHKFIYHEDVEGSGGDDMLGKMKTLNDNSDKTLALVDKLRDDAQEIKRTEEEIKQKVSEMLQA